MREARICMETHNLEWGKQVIGNRYFRVVTVCLLVLALFSINIVPSESMDPTLRINDLVAYKRGKAVERQDIILFKNPLDKTEKYVKRVIGVAGDEIKIVAGAVYLNGSQLDETYVEQDWFVDEQTLIVPNGMLYVLGDNRNNSLDSREFGVVPVEDVLGRASFVLLPIQRFGKSW